MRARNRSTVILGAFVFVIGLLFTLMAPGGLGELTMVAGLAFLIAAFAPVDVIRRLGTRRTLYFAMLLIAIGVVAIVVNWSGAPAWTIYIAGATFLGGLVLLTLFATAPKDMSPLPDGAPRGAAAEDRSSLSDGSPRA